VHGEKHPDDGHRQPFRCVGLIWRGPSWCRTDRWFDGILDPHNYPNRPFGQALGAKPLRCRVIGRHQARGPPLHSATQDRRSGPHCCGDFPTVPANVRRLRALVRTRRGWPGAIEAGGRPRPAHCSAGGSSLHDNRPAAPPQTLSGLRRARWRQPRKDAAHEYFRVRSRFRRESGVRIAVGLGDVAGSRPPLAGRRAACYCNLWTPSAPEGGRA